MAVIRCPACGKPNPDFLEICQYCDAPLKGEAAAAVAAAATPPEAAQKAAEPGIIRCQACGKPNPEFLEVCQYCEARLKPLAAGTPAAHDIPPASPLGDTLSRLRSTAAPTPAEPEPEETAEPAPSDWMSRLQGTAAPSPSPAPGPSQNEPDWLWGGSTESSETTQADTPALGEEKPDWLRSLGSAGPETPSFGPAPSQAEPEFLWGAPASAEPAPSATPAPAEDVPDWLRSMGSAEPEPPAAAPAVPAEDVPDWLRSMGSAEPEPSAAAPATPAEDMPDWLRSMGSAEPEPPAAAPATPAEDVPDWLRSMGSAEPESATAAPTAASVPFEEAPDWLSSMGAEPTSAPATAETPFDEMPDWLRAMGGTEAPSSEPASPSFAPAPTQAEPEFLWGAPEAAETAEPEAAPSEETPDWLRSLGGETAAAPQAGSSTPEETEAAPKVSPFAVPSGEMPDWLQGKAPDSSAAPAAPADEAPDWLSGLRSSAAAAESSAPTGEELAPGEMPAWLGSMTAGTAEIPHTGPLPETPESPRPQPAASIFGRPTTPAKGNLAQAALPGWLSAMRPVDVGRPTVEPEMDSYEETVGFLAGVPGILRAEPTVALPRKSTVNVHNLEVNPAQAERASLLTSLLQADVEARPASKPGLQIALPFERWLVFLLVALAVIVPSVLLPGFFPPPQTIGLETQAAYITIDSLPNDKPVLVAFDYEPAQMGELNPVAEALLTHLMRRGVPIVGVSTHLGGAAVGDDLLKQLSLQLAPHDDPALNPFSIGYTYTYGIHYTNLGYIPGGAVGVLQFALGPRSLFTADFSGDPEVWQQEVVSRVNALSDFGLILILSATPDSARAWIEQVHYASKSINMIAAVSAAAEPLVRPYYEANPPQLKGLVSGVLSAAQYEQQAGVPSAATERWGAVGGGLLAAALLLVGGNVVYGLLGFIRRRRAA